ncbi:hypothetical protein D6D24_10750 [Aureobasidium pullulans]|uniref:Uncharacterized protein n=1 Tax=Aureobasidium pullulans TaxID=5580 RepID=A0A4S8UYX3_AURPU|nr:hypothetical protein D6D24_10750 [Aureobasidium pullulans]
MMRLKKKTSVLCFRLVTTTSSRTALTQRTSARKRLTLEISSDIEKSLPKKVLGEAIKSHGEGHYNDCLYRPSYGVETTHCFGGYLLSFLERAAKAFLELVATYERAIVNVEPKELEVESKAVQDGSKQIN